MYRGTEDTRACVRACRHECMCAHVCVCPPSLRPHFDSAETFVLAHVMPVVTGTRKKVLCAVVSFCSVSMTGFYFPAQAIKLTCNLG